MSNKRLMRVTILILAIGAFIGIIVASGFDFTGSSRSIPIAPTRPTVVLGSQDTIPQELIHLQNTSDAFIYIAEKVVPTVVTIQSSRLISSADLEKYHKGDELKDFFRFRFPKEFRQEGSGSGIIVSEDGYILTNVHVVDNSEEIRVLLYDNREFEANLVGIDPLTEVAVIKIDAQGLPVPGLGNSDRVRVGEWVLAIGNPLELRSTVTAGIISAKERQIGIIQDTFSVESFLQTDAAINPGNSGGALVNLRGEVIGVNTAIATETGYSAGFGFAIPINLAKKIMLDLISKGKVERGYLGIAMQNMDEKKARAFSLQKPMGVFIDKVLGDGPAGRAGVKAKDILIKIDDQEVNKSNQVQAIIARKDPGDFVELELLRNGKKINLQVALGKHENGGQELAYIPRDEDFENLGIEVVDLTRERASEIGYSGRAGVLVTSVARRSPAMESGIMADDVISEIGDISIENVKDFNRAISNLDPGSVVIFTINRVGETFHLFVEIK